MGLRMSAQATFTKGNARGRFRAIETVLACGPVSLAIVAASGVAFAFFLWYSTITHVHAGAGFDEIALVLAVLVGVPAVAVAWYAYGLYFARRAGIGVVTALRSDAPTWASFVFYPLGLLAPVSIGSPAHAAGFAIGLFALSKIFIAARYVHTVRDVLLTFVVTRLAIIVIAELASITIAQRPGLHVAASTNPLLAVWGRWDAVHYLDIAQRGYYGTDMAFFPLYPMLIHLVGRFVGNGLVAGLLLSNVALFFGLLYFYKLVEHQFTRAVAHRAIFYVSIFPTAIFFSAVYTESLFFALTVASFYYIREHKWIVAGLIGALAALTRSEGVLLAVPFAIEVFSSAHAVGFKRFFTEPRRLVRIGIGLALVPLGLALYMAWLWVLHGDPLYFSHVQSHWNRHLAPPWVSFIHAFKILGIAHAKHLPLPFAEESIELVFTLLMIGVLGAGVRRLRPSFTAYMALSILVPLSTSSLMSMPRFALVLFPMFVVLALWGGRSWVNSTIVAFSLPLLGLFTVLFADWYWVA
jgi:hypothetical protein